MIIPCRRARSVVGVVLAATAVVLLAGCSSGPPQVQTSVPRVAEGTLGPAAGPGPGRTYDPELAPEGASLRAELAPWGGGTRATLTARGLLPDRAYAVHAHRDACGPTGDAAGPHYQDDPDPRATAFAASTDPAYANPRNEIWLDLRTDAAGAGTATAIVQFATSIRGPSSIVVHEGMQTMTGPGVAGTAGARLACLDLR